MCNINQTSFTENEKSDILQTIQLLLTEQNDNSEMDDMEVLLQDVCFYRKEVYA